MRFKFLNWYTHALGSAIGILSALFGYLNGYMGIPGNSYIEYIHNINPLGIIAGYVMLPLCLLNIVFAMLKAYTNNQYEEKMFNISILSINRILILTTIILGFIGSREYFILPAIFITFNLYSNKLFKGNKYKDLIKVNDNHEKEIRVKNEDQKI